MSINLFHKKPLSRTFVRIHYIKEKSGRQLVSCGKIEKTLILVVMNYERFFKKNNKCNKKGSFCNC